MRILIIKTTSLGDVVHNLPIIADIKQYAPNAQIDWVVEDSFADILKLHPHINNIIPVAIRRWRKALFSKQTWREFLAFKRQLQAQQYDYVLDTQGLIKSAWLCRLAKISNKNARHGHNKNSAREPLAACFYQHTHAISKNLHAVARNRILAALALSYTAPTSAPNYGVMADLTRLKQSAFALPSQYLLALHSTSRESKCWPIEHWIALGKAMQQRGLALVLPWGNAAEELRAKAIAEAVPSALLLPNPLVLPKLGIASLAAIIANAQVIVGVDTGLVHLAVALNKPTVAIYTDTNPALTGVYPSVAGNAINLGSAGNTPQPQAVLQAILQLI